MRNRHLYPDNWNAIALEVKNHANWQCQGCGKQCRRTGQSLADFIAANPQLPKDVQAKPIRYVLTVAHLDHTPSNCDRSNLKALCSVCHLRYDAQHHVNSRRVNKRKQLEESGQLTLNL